LAHSRELASDLVNDGAQAGGGSKLANEATTRCAACVSSFSRITRSTAERAFAAVTVERAGRWESPLSERANTCVVLIDSFSE
jgi:hypothetical protein